ncbi:MAG: hypothetical protein QM785_02960 [Pyrinomonadaceae bacterium]
MSQLSYSFHRKTTRTTRALYLALATLVLSGNVIAQCSLENTDKTWLEQTIRSWKKVRQNGLKLKAAKLPWLVLFDENCVYNIGVNKIFFESTAQPEVRSLAGENVTVYSAPHTGKIALPDGQIIPAQLVSFAANYDNDKNSFFVAALPSIWKKAEHLKTENNITTLVRAVYIHELTHTYHRNFFARLSEIEKGLKDVENFDDDVIQNTFGKDERFRASYLDEIAMASTAAKQTDITKKRLEARVLLSAIKQRRSQNYTGENKKFEEVEDIFLTMEGVANWAGYRAAIADGLDEATASKLIRRSGKNWSQEEGILLFMIIDRLLPNWQRIAFGESRVSIVNLLERAVR